MFKNTIKIEDGFDLKEYLKAKMSNYDVKEFFKYYNDEVGGMLLKGSILIDDINEEPETIKAIEEGDYNIITYAATDNDAYIVICENVEEPEPEPEPEEFEETALDLYFL